MTISSLPPTSDRSNKLATDVAFVARFSERCGDVPFWSAARFGAT
jgi:hypothetical protein